MNTQEKIQYYKEKMSVKFALDNYINIAKLADEIRRYIKKNAIEKKIAFNSSDVRGFVMAIGKVHKSINKQIDFAEQEKRLKKYDCINDDAFSDYTNDFLQRAACLRDLQSSYSILNYCAMILKWQEIQNTKQNNDLLFNQELIKTVRGFL